MTLCSGSAYYSCRVCLCVCAWPTLFNSTVNSEHLLEDIGGDASRRQ